MNPYRRMTSDDFDRILRQLTSDMTVETLLAIPGVYEALAEELTNDVLRRWDASPEGLAAWQEYNARLVPTEEEPDDFEFDDTFNQPVWTGWNSVE